MTSKDAGAGKKPGARGRPRNLSREAIVAAALAVMEREGYGALSMRSLGLELGVAHSNLYNYVGHIEDVEVEALNMLASSIPLPVSTKPPALRVELVEHLHAARQLLIKHPTVVYPPLGSSAFKTFAKFTQSWIEALVPFAPDPAGAAIAYSALVSYVMTIAERERIYGADYARGSRKIVLDGFPAIPAAVLEFDQVLATLIDRLLPGFNKRAASGGRK
jgi:AcrR family transcriptional regulator